jgi:nicotinamidase-related amidase
MNAKFRRIRTLALAGAVLTATIGVNLAPQAPAATPPTPPPPTAFSFAGGGDMGWSPEAAGTIKAIGAAGVDFSLHFGDMAYDQIYPESAWCDFIKDPQNGVGPDFPYEIVAGGHDLGSGPGPAAQYRTVLDKYLPCLPDRMGSTGTYGKEYYFDHPAAAPLMRVIMVSPSITMPDGTKYDYSPGTAHYQWVSDAIDGARAAGIPVIYVRMGLRPGDPEVSPRNRAMVNAVRSGMFTEGAPGAEIHDDIAPQQGDVVVTKRRGSAFSGSDLDLVLRARDIDSLVLTGIATSAVVLSTLWHAVDLDFGLTVLADACLDTDPEVHTMLTEKLFPQWADVVAVEDWLKAIAPR